MSVIYILILISLLMALVFLAGFFWAVKSDQFKDDFGPAVRILYEADQNKDSKIEESNSDNNKDK